MTSRPAYRLTVYQDRYTDPTESTVLSPAAGAPHSDPFKVATVSGLSGFQPYLDPPTGTRGALDVLTKHVTTGQMTFPLLDKRTDTAQPGLSRWVTAFLGDTQGRNQLTGNKCYAEECLDWNPVTLTGSWSPFWVGRIDGVSLVDPLHVELQTLDFADDLNIPCFGTRPYAGLSYVAEASVLPIGITAQYGQVPAVTALGASVGAAAYTRGTLIRLLTLDNASVARLDNLLTAAVLGADGGAIQGLGSIATIGTGVGLVGTPLPLRVRFSAAGLGITNKELQVLRFYTTKRSDGHFAITHVLATELKKADGSAATGDPAYTAFDTTTIPNSTVITFRTLFMQLPGSSATAPRGFSPARGSLGSTISQVPIDLGKPALLLGDVNYMTFLADLLDGKFATLYTAEDTAALPSGAAIGDPRFSVPYDTAGARWDALANPVSGALALPVTRWSIPQSYKLFDIIEKTAQWTGVAFRFKPALKSGVPVSLFEPVDLRLPNSTMLGSPNTITDADLDTTVPAHWEQSRQTAISDLTVTWYLDVVTDATTVSKSTDAVPAVAPTLITPAPQPVYLPALGGSRAVAIGSKPMAIDALGLRATVDQDDTQQAMQAAKKASDEAKAISELLYRNLFGAGAELFTFRARRTTNTASLYQGDWVYFAGSQLPNPGTNLRGGTRLILITERNEDKANIDFKAIAVGAGAFCNAPTIGTPTQTSGDTNHSIDVVVTLNAQSEPAEVRYLVDSSVALTSSPAANDPRWTYAGRRTATGTLTIPNLPSHNRIFVEARSVSAPASTAGSLKLPSAYATPSGTKYVDTATIGAPTSLSITPASILATSTIVGNWLNTATGSAALRMRVSLEGVLVEITPAGSVMVTLNPYITLSSHLYTLSLQYQDELGGVSTAATVTFTTAGSFTGPTLTAPTIALG